MSSKLHPDGKLTPIDTVTNASGNNSIIDLIEQRQLSRRGFLITSLGASAGLTATAMLGTTLVDSLTNFAKAAPAPLGGIGFTAVAANTAPMTDAVTVPMGYTARVLASWGDSLTADDHWDSAGAMDEATQLRTFGAHNDGMHYFPFPGVRKGQGRGLLVVNHEYCDPGLVTNVTNYSDTAFTITPAMVDAQLAAHGVSVAAVDYKKGVWGIQRPSGFNRRITGMTPCAVSGPAAGNELLTTAADPAGMTVLGTLNNCAHGYTPWGTYLACEENFNGYFGTTADLTTAPLSGHEKRYGISASGFGYRWHEANPRFDIRANINETNRFGWVVEIDPWNPNSTPVKRTALGRFKHEGAWVVLGEDNSVAVYMGDDERNEYLYKFVCAGKYNRNKLAANRDLLDSGTLYVAKLNANGTGTWIPLLWNTNGLTLENGFGSQAEVLIKCRQAGDLVGATMMDRPEWIAAHPTTRELYMTLTNNSRRGNTPVSSNNADGSTTAATANPPVDAANPRPDNDFGHIIRWREDMASVAATSFEWDIFAQCGDKNTAKALGSSYTPGEFGGQNVGYQGNIDGDDYGAPDGLWFDKDGRLWIQTDQAGNSQGDWVNIGGNVMMCADPSTGMTKRFLTSPPHSEVTGVVTTPDGKAMFVGIQHPGEDWADSFTANSTWPDNGANGATTFTGSTVNKPRSSVVVITKDDGGVIGT